MKTVCIAGAMSGVGKTTLAEQLLSRFHNWAAIKVTACVGGTRHHCPRGKSTECGVCSSLKENYVIETGSEIIEEAGTDTARFKSAGAKRVLWIKAKPRYVNRALQKALEILSDYDGVIFEGNHVLKHFDPDVAVMIRSKDNRFKRSARDVLDKVDMFVDYQCNGESVEKIFDAISVKALS
jgi:molybdopterin-guanine dinucleotide biosynthesis protein